ncbi:MAG: L-seryl-tRNA(Sec) selenium transferase [Spirochaetes bacterium]|nr:L-seryl-tRNA(Sec) selenium transferase [Spirochaetota bacterium]
MEEKNQILRNIPQVEKVLQSEDVRRFVPDIGRPAIVDIIREVLAGIRKRIDDGETVSPEDVVPAVVSRCALKRMKKLQRVINGTGVIIHTNLGRSPLGADLLKSLAETLPGYCNLELVLPEGKRGSRGGFAEELISRMTGAGDALIVNNNASSVFLILNEFARGREVVISRGELVQIGGGFRIPDIMRQSGAHMVEVGTTNITTIEDYRRALTGETAMIFSCHRSNFTMDGFTDKPSLANLASLKTDSLLFVRDLGSGNVTTDQRLPRSFEPTVRFELEQGPDLVCFSGDKLLGGCQAGIIVGRKDLVARLRRNPLMRMLRVDKVAYFLLQETLIRHSNGEAEEIALWQVMLQDEKAIGARIARFLRLVSHPAKERCIRRVDTQSVVGGGAMPGFHMKSRGLSVDVPGLTARDLYTAFISAEVPVVGSIVDDRFILDFRTILDRDVSLAAGAAGRILERHCGGE